MASSICMPVQSFYDVVICGAGLAGLTLAYQLKSSNPELRVVLLDRMSGQLPVATLKVGESSTEIGSHYLSHTLNLETYLENKHYRKLGLRFFLPNQGNAFHDRPEIGLTNTHFPYAYNFDRGLLETDLREMAVSKGAQLLEGCSVRDIEIKQAPGERHRVIFNCADSPEPQQIQCGWVVDAMGRRRFLQKKLGIDEPNQERHSAAWFRMEGKIDVSDLVPKTLTDWHQRVTDRPRIDSTNHLCGPGYWVWIIRLSSDHTSVGLVTDEAVHPFKEYNTYEKLLLWLQKHEPGFAEYLGERQPKDFKRLAKYTYSAKQIFSSDRWSCVGEAATFIDPLYSTGTDMIGLANCMTTNLIEKDRQQQLDQQAIDEANLFFLSFNDTLAENVKTAYSCFQHPLASAFKTIWDTMAGWAFSAPILINSLYSDTRFRETLWPDAGRFFLLTHIMQQFLQAWAAKPARASFEFIDYLGFPFVRELRARNLQKIQSADELLAVHRQNVKTFEEFAQVIFRVAIEDTDPDKLPLFPDEKWLNAWGISFDAKRWQQDRLFTPESESRDISAMLAQVRGCIRYPHDTPSSKERLSAAISISPPLEYKENSPRTLIDALHLAAQTDRGITYILEDGSEARQSYSDLLRVAKLISNGLSVRGKKSGEVVLLQISDNQEYISALWGCLLGGFVAAPISVPVTYGSENPESARFWNTWNELEQPTIIAGNSNAEILRIDGLIDNSDGVECISFDELLTCTDVTTKTVPDPEGLAFLLFTSGSTGTPKAVELRHSSILSRAAGRAHHFGFSDRDISVNWFPLDHVASLVMFHMRDVFLKCEQIHAPTHLALEDPLRWLDWLDRYKATITWAPNFAYGLVSANSNPADKGRWDLSNLRCIINGGEPITASTAETFIARLEEHGLPANTMYPDWGMTELCAGVVCCEPIDVTDIREKPVCLGRPIPGTSFRVVDTLDNIATENQVGRVQVKGSTVTNGYFNAAKLTSELFTEDGWLKTGDLGFLNKGKLSITGREKEAVIINGLNFNYSEIEEIVERLDNVLRGCTAACAVRKENQDTDQLVIFFCSLHRQEDLVKQQINTIRITITKALGISPSVILPVKKTDIPRSSVGKKRREVLTQRLTDGAYEQLLDTYRASPTTSSENMTATERKIMAIWSDAFGRPISNLDDNFFEIGGHSLIAIMVLGKLKEAFNVKFEMGSLFEAPTIRLLAQCVSSTLEQD